MKTFIAMLAFLALTPVIHAQPYPEIEAAFKTFADYQKTDDDRLVDLYTKDVSVTFIVVHGTESKKTVVPSKIFLEIIKTETAKKKGGNDKYTDIKVTAVEGGFRVDCILVHSKSGLPSPYIQEYVKTPEGLKISKVVVTFPSSNVNP